MKMLKQSFLSGSEAEIPKRNFSRRFEAEIPKRNFPRDTDEKRTEIPICRFAYLKGKKGLKTTNEVLRFADLTAHDERSQ